jgi:hypothetical protein
MDVMLNASRLTYASVGVGLVFLFLFFKIMFRAPGSFEQDARNSLRRRPILYDPDYVDRGWCKLKIFLWLALSAAGGWAAHHKLPELLPNFFP